MSRNDDGLDALIDRVARDMTAGEPPAAIAAGVRARMAQPERLSLSSGWRLASAAAAAVVLVVAAVVSVALWPEPPVEAPVVRVAPPAVQDSPAVARNGPGVAIDGSDVPSGVEERREAAADVSRSAAAATTTATPPLPPIELLNVMPIDDPALIAEMSGLAMPIEIEPLQIAPLELQ